MYPNVCNSVLHCKIPKTDGHKYRIIKISNLNKLFAILQLFFIIKMNCKKVCIISETFPGMGFLIPAKLL